MVPPHPARSLYVHVESPTTGLDVWPSHTHPVLEIHMGPLHHSPLALVKRDLMNTNPEDLGTLPTASPTATVSATSAHPYSLSFPQTRGFWDVRA